MYVYYFAVFANWYDAIMQYSRWWGFQDKNKYKQPNTTKLTLKVVVTIKTFNYIPDSMWKIKVLSLTILGMIILTELYALPIH